MWVMSLLTLDSYDCDYLNFSGCIKEIISACSRSLMFLTHILIIFHREGYSLVRHLWNVFNVSS